MMRWKVANDNENTNKPTEKLNNTEVYHKKKKKIYQPKFNPL